MEKRRKKILFINNILSPYRNYFFNRLAEKNFDFEVIHMSESTPDRNWKSSDIHYVNHIDRFGLVFKYHNNYDNFNPILILKLIFFYNNFEYIIGGWGGINQIIICFLKKIGLIRKRLHLWCEANYLDETGEKTTTGISNFLRKFVVSTIDGDILIPGQMAKNAINYFGINVAERKYIYLPNIIEENVFHIKKNNDINTFPVFISPVRLVEKLKGLLNFFNAIGLDNIKKAIFLIAGDGIDRHLYKQYIKEYKLENHIKLLGFKNSVEMDELYNKSNVLLLPSFYDPSPLSLVEASRVGLPILCSTHCGNHFEIVKSGKNGFVFNPLDHSDIKNKYEKLLECKNYWNSYSIESKSIYNNNFESNKVLDNFIKKIKVEL